MLDLVVLANDRPAPSVGGAAETAPTRPEDEREQGAERAHGKKDPTDRVDLDPAHRRVDSPDEYCPGGDEKKADSHTHIAFSFRWNSVPLQGKRRTLLRRYGRGGAPEAARLPVQAYPGSRTRIPGGSTGFPN